MKAEGKTTFYFPSLFQSKRKFSGCLLKQTLKYKARPAHFCQNLRTLELKHTLFFIPSYQVFMLSFLQIYPSLYPLEILGQSRPLPCCTEFLDCTKLNSKNWPGPLVILVMLPHQRLTGQSRQVSSSFSKTWRIIESLPWDGEDLRWLLPQLHQLTPFSRVNSRQSPLTWLWGFYYFGDETDCKSYSIRVSCAKHNPTDSFLFRVAHGC